MTVNQASSLQRVYLDVCSLCRPFDNQRQMRIRLETSAVELILEHVRQAKLALIISPVHFTEIEAIAETEERKQLLLLLDELSTQLDVNLQQARKRAEKFVDAGLGIADAAHLAFAEQANAEFITVDDRLIKRSRRVNLSVWCGTPPAFCERIGLS